MSRVSRVSSLDPGQCRLPMHGQLRANMTSSTKPEIHNALHCHQRRTEPRPQLACIENFVKYGV